MQLSVAPNQNPINGSPQFALQGVALQSSAGSLEVHPVQNFTSSGNQTGLPFSRRASASISQKISAAGLPNSATVELSASAPVVVNVQS